MTDLLFIDPEVGKAIMDAVRESWICAMPKQAREAFREWDKWVCECEGGDPDECEGECV